MILERAETTGQDIGQIALAVLSWGLSLNDEDFFETLNGIQRGLNDFDQGESSSLDDFIAEQNQKYGIALKS